MGHGAWSMGHGAKSAGVTLYGRPEAAGLGDWVPRFPNRGLEGRPDGAKGRLGEEVTEELVD